MMFVNALATTVAALLPANASVPAAASIHQVTQEAYIKASNPGSQDSFGWSVAISGDTMVVGAQGEDSSSGIDGDQSLNDMQQAGAAYVFVRSGGVWMQQAYLKPSHPGLGDWFGNAVAIDGDTIVVCAMREDGGDAGVGGDPSDNSKIDSGAAYVFTRNGTTWTQQAYLKASNAQAGDNFGNSVAMSGDTVVVGAYLEDGASGGVDGNQSSNTATFAGAAYVFAREGTTWTQQAYLKSSHPDSQDYFGVRVAIDGDTVVVSVPEESSSAVGVDGNAADNSAPDSGAAFVFVRSGTSWSQQAYLKASNTGAGDNLRSVAVHGDTIVLGANWEAGGATGVDGDQLDDSQPFAGAAYVFVRDGTTWTQQAYIKAPNTDAGDYFGTEAALEGDLLVLAASAEDSAASGVDGDSLDNSLPDAGAVYVYRREGTSWHHVAYLKASNPGHLDRFGFTVGLDGGLLGVGTGFEDSSASGINGDQHNDSMPWSGAVYVFDICGLYPSSETVRLGTPPNPPALLPGATSGPVVGAVWDPAIDHTAFVPNALVDALALGFETSNVPTPWGTVLAGLAPPIVLFTAPGTAFAVPIPASCSLVGLTLAAQGASVDALFGLALTNALDIVVGGS